MLSSGEYVNEEWTNLKVVLHVETTGSLALGKSQDSIGLVWDTELVRDEEEVQRIHAEREGLQTDLVLRLSAFNMHKTAIFLLCDRDLRGFEVGGGVRVILRSLAVVAVSALDQEPIGTGIVDDFHFLIALTDVDGTSVEVFNAIGDGHPIVEAKPVLSAAKLRLLVSLEFH